MKFKLKVSPKNYWKYFHRFRVEKDSKHITETFRGHVFNRFIEIYVTK